jgi:hypothetical protein
MSGLSTADNGDQTAGDKDDRSCSKLDGGRGDGVADFAPSRTSWHPAAWTHRRRLSAPSVREAPRAGSFKKVPEGDIGFIEAIQAGALSDATAVIRPRDVRANTLALTHSGAFDPPPPIR